MRLQRVTGSNAWHFGRYHGYELFREGFTTDWKLSSSWMTHILKTEVVHHVPVAADHHNYVPLFLHGGLCDERLQTGSVCTLSLAVYVPFIFMVRHLVRRTTSGHVLLQMQCHWRDIIDGMTTSSHLALKWAYFIRFTFISEQMAQGPPCNVSWWCVSRPRHHLQMVFLVEAGNLDILTLHFVPGDRECPCKYCRE